MRLRREHRPASLTADGNGLVLVTDYNQGLVSWIKSLPVSDRKWNGTAWVIHPKHGPGVVNAVKQHMWETVTLPVVTQQVSGPQTGTLDVLYIGTCKEQPSGESVAFGWSGEAWSVIFPEAVLRSWFHIADNDPTFAESLYAVLAVERTANPEQIKKAYRMMSRQWHPDVCAEPDANEKFIRIGKAYDVLSDTNQRDKYDAGLALSATMEGNGYKRVTFRSPVRCGRITAEYLQKLSRKEVTKIVSWGDIKDGTGRVLVTSWRMGDKHFTERWIEANNE